jgi:glutathione S-transferase
MSPPPDPGADAPYRFITIPFSHFCEKARWALDRVGVPYVEEPHGPVVHYRATAPLGHRTVPILVSRAGVFADSTDILEYLDGFAPAEDRLYPADPALRREVLELEDRFDRRLGPATRVLAYSTLLQDRALTLELFARGTSRSATRALGLVLPAIIALMRSGMKINPSNVPRVKARLDELFASVEQRLADGRRFLCGDRLTAADVTFASLAAPAVLPPAYEAMLLPIERLPAAHAAEVRRLRERPVGAFVLRLFAEERTRRVTAD